MSVSVRFGGDRRLAIGGKLELGRGDEHRLRQDAGQDRQRVDAGIEHAEPARLPDPVLPGMPDADVFLPVDVHRFDRAAPRATRAPARPRAHSANARSQTAFALPPAAIAINGSSSATPAPGGFSSMTCLPAASAVGGLGAAHLRRRAERHRVDLRSLLQQLLEGREMRQVRQRGVAAGDCGERRAGHRGDRADMLVARDLAEADDGDAKFSHDFSPLSADGSARPGPSRSRCPHGGACRCE